MHLHPYSTDSNERRHVPLLLAFLSALSAYVLGAIIDALEFKVWWVEIPSVLGFYGLWYLWFDKKLWRLPFLRRIGLIKVPDLEGKWIAKGESTYKQRSFTASVTIKQTWTGIFIHWKTDQSLSHSRAASLIVGDIDECTLLYNYENIPRGGKGTPSSMEIHRGSVELRFQRQNGDVVAEGEYYSGRGRENYGIVTLTRES